ncbi:hypothetical protein WH96_00010, partial [Kiloniella spongiae]
MTDDLKRNDGEAMVDTNDVNVVGETGRDVLVGQAAGAVDVSAPGAGETVNVTLVKGQSANLNFDATAATPVVDGNDFVLTFDSNGDGEADSRIVFQNLVEESQGADAPVLIIGGVELSAGLLIGQAQALAEGETLETAAGAGAGPTGGGGSTYSDDLGSAIDLLDAQGVLGGTLLEFGLLGGSEDITDPAQGTLLINFITTTTEVDEFPSGGISGTFAGGFEDWLPNQHLSGGDTDRDSSPFEGGNGSNEGVSAAMRMTLTFTPADNETLDSLVLDALPEGARLFIGGNEVGDEFTGTFPVTITPADFDEIYILPPVNSDADITVTGLATISDPDSGETQTLSYSSVAVIDAVADLPDELRIGNDDGGENGVQIPTDSTTTRSVSSDGEVVNSGKEEEIVTIPVTVDFGDFADDSEAHELVVDGVPVGWDIRPVPGAEIWQMDGDNVYQVTFDTDGKPVLTLVTDTTNLPASLQHQIALAAGEVPAPGALNPLENTIGDETADDGYVRYFIDVSENVDEANGGNTPDTSDDGTGSLTTNISFAPNDWTNSRLPDGTLRDGDGGDQGGPATITVHAVATETLPDESGAEVTDPDGTPVDENNQAVTGPVSVDISIEEDVPEFTSPITLIHDETQRTVSDKGVGVDPDSNDIADVPASIQTVLDTRYKVLKDDEGATLGETVGQAQNTFTYDLKSDGSKDEDDGSDLTISDEDNVTKIRDTDATLNDDLAIPDDLEAITFNLPGDVDSGLTSGGSVITLRQDPEQPQVVWGIDASGDVIFAVHIDGTLGNNGNTGNLTFVQYGPIDHDQPGDGGEGSHDENASFNLPVKLTDDEGDSVTATATINIEDDGPTVEVNVKDDGNGRATLSLGNNLDESIGTDTGDANAASDDVIGNTTPDPTGTNPIGRIGTASDSKALSDLFNVVIDAGTDGEKSVAHQFELTLSENVIATTLSVTQPVTGAPYADPSIELVLEGEEIIGRFLISGSEAGGDAVYGTALRISLDDVTSLENADLTVEQYVPIDHGADSNDHDSLQSLLTSGDGVVGLKLTTTVTDGDGDTATSNDTVILADNENSSIGIEDDGPSVDVSVKTVGQGEDAEPVRLSLNNLDESIGTDTNDANAASDDVAGNTASDPTGANPIGRVGTLANSGSLSDLFNRIWDAGTDGEKTVAHQFELTLSGNPAQGGGIATNLEVTQGTGSDEYEDTKIYLFLENGQIVGRFDNNPGDNNPFDGIALRISLDEADSLVNADLIVEQYVAIDHGGDSNEHDSLQSLLTSGDESSVGLKLTTTVTDGDGDSASDSATVVLADENNSSIGIEDDGPSVDVSVKTVGQGEDAEPVTLTLNSLDESTGEDTGDLNADSDDTGDVVPDPTGEDPIGRVRTARDSAALSDLFDVDPDAGTDGLGDLEHEFELTLSSAVVATTLSVTQPATGSPYADPSIELVMDGDEIVGRFLISGSEAGGDAVYGVALRISLDDTDSLTDADLKVEQYVPIDHGDDGNDHDSIQNLLTTGDDVVGLKLTTTITDGDGDTSSDSATVVLANKDDGSISIEDDGPAITSFTTKDGVSTKLTLDESLGADVGDSNAADEETVGAPANAIGYAKISGTDLINIAVDAGTDGEKSRVFSLTLDDQIASGLVDTASGETVALSLDGDVITGTAGGETVFTITVDPATGGVTVVQYRALKHDKTDDHDENSDPLELATGAIKLAVTVTDGDGDTDSESTELGDLIKFEDDGPVNTLEAVSKTVEEDNLTDGNDEDASGSTVATGSVAGLIDFGSDGAAAGGGFSFADNLTNLPVLTSNGLSVSYAVSGDTLTASTTAGPVFTLKLEANGAYTFTLKDQIDHHPVNAADNAEGFVDLDLSSAIVATDGDGDSVTVDNGFTIRVQDDIPVALEDAEVSGSVQEDALADGNTETTVPAQTTVSTGSVTGLFSAGADNPGTYSLLTDTNDLPALKSGGVDVEYIVSGDTLTATAGGNEVFTLKLEADGGYTFTLKDQIDHENDPTNDDGQTTTIDFGSLIRLTDADGDYVDATGKLNISIEDDIPENNDVAAKVFTVHEDALNGPSGGDSSQGNPDPGDTEFASFTVSDLANHVAVGADAPARFELNADITGQAVTTPDGTPITSNGHPVTYVYDNAEQISGVANGVPIFQLQILNNGTFRFDLDDQIDHLPNIPANNDGQVLGIDISSLLKAFDADGDSVVLDSAVTINVQDDIPVANVGAKVEGSVQEDALADGNRENAGQTTVASGSVSALFSVGADDPGTYSLLTNTNALPALKSGGVDVEYSVSGDTLTATAGGNEVFTLKLEADGTYTFTLKDQIDHANDPTNDDSQTTTIDFGSLIRLTDADGDYVDATGNLNISIEDDIPVVVPSSTLIEVQEDALPDGNNEGSKQTFTDISFADLAAHVSFGADAHDSLPLSTFNINSAIDGTPTGLVSDDASIVFKIINSGQVYGVVPDTNGGPDKVVFTIIKKPNEVFQFELLEQIDHPDDAGSDDSQTIDLDLSNVFEAFDADGDSVIIDSGITVRIEDDIPTVDISDETSVVEGQTLTGTRDGDFGADGAASSDSVVITVDGVSGTHAIGDAIDVPGKGTLTIVDATNWSFAADPGVDHTNGNPQVSFTVAVTDGDGDVATKTETFEITPAVTPPTVTITTPDEMPDISGDQAIIKEDGSKTVTATVTTEQDDIVDVVTLTGLDGAATYEVTINGVTVSVLGGKAELDVASLTTPPTFDKQSLDIQIKVTPTGDSDVDLGTIKVEATAVDPGTTVKSAAVNDSIDVVVDAVLDQGLDVDGSDASVNEV